MAPIPDAERQTVWIYAPDRKLHPIIRTCCRRIQTLLVVEFVLKTTFPPTPKPPTYGTVFATSDRSILESTWDMWDGILLPDEPESAIIGEITRVIGHAYRRARHMALEHAIEDAAQRLLRLESQEDAHPRHDGKEDPSFLTMVLDPIHMASIEPNGQQHKIPPADYHILAFLLSHPNHILSAAECMDLKMVKTEVRHSVMTRLGRIVKLYAPIVQSVGRLMYIRTKGIVFLPHTASHQHSPAHDHPRYRRENSPWNDSDMREDSPREDDIPPIRQSDGTRRHRRSPR